MSTGAPTLLADVHPSAYGSGDLPAGQVDSDSRSNDQANSSSTSDLGEEYPEQKHAGRIGYGPLHDQGANFTDKIGGLKEQIAGKIKRDPNLVQHGKDRRTGVAKHRQTEEDDEDPFATPGHKESPSLSDEQKFQEPSTPLQVHQRRENEVEETATVDPEYTDRTET